MSHEIEIKVLDIDKDKVLNKIIALGAQKIQETRLSVDWYRPKGVQEGEDPWFLRIRSNSQGKYEVTWKARSDITGVARRHKEINFFSEHPRELEDLFEEIGLEKYAHQEKDRVSFTYKDFSFDIDTYPHMPPYLEIEGTSEQYIKDAMTMLALENNKTWAEGERTLIQNVYGLDWYSMQF